MAKETGDTRSRRRRWAVIAAVVVITALVALGQTSLVSRAAVEVAVRSTPRDQAVGPALAAKTTDETTVFLVVGNDTRDAVPTDVTDWFGPLTGQRADLLLLMAVDTDENELRLLSIPRDLAVNTEPYGPLTLAEAFGFGSGPLLVTSLSDLTGVNIHHYVEVSFDGFVRLIDDLGGLSVEFCEPTRDLYTGLDVPAGSVSLDGEAALALARSRAFEQREASGWVPIKQGEAGRIDRQLFVVDHLVRDLRSDPGIPRLFGLARSAPGLAVLDEAVDAATIHQAMRIARAGSVSAQVIPVAPVRTQAERLSPFGPAHLGGRLYLEPTVGAVDALNWLTGAAESSTPDRPLGADEAEDCL